MKAIIKGIWIDSADFDLETYLPDDLENFGLWINFRAGPSDSEGAHDYQLLVCTPEWLKNEYKSSKAVWGYGILIVFEYDLNMIKLEIDNRIESCAGENWHVIAKKISKFAAWEYEDYQK